MATIASHTVPRISVSGSPLERGRRHGELLAERIALGVDRYMERFAHFAGLTREQARVEALRYVEPIRAYDEEILDEIRSLWRRRDDRYSEIRSSETAGLPKVEMSKIGG
jgi:hypothetical protein